MSRIEWAGRTDAGAVRETNEDAFSVFAFTVAGAGRQADSGSSPDQAPGGMLFTVADGVGGQNAGEIASALVVRGLPEELAGLAGSAAPLPSRECGKRLETALRRTNGRVRQESASDPGLKGMAATASVLWLLGGRGFLGHVGDSRVYRYREGELQHLSHEQSAVGRAVRAGELSEAEGKVAARRNVLDQAMGVPEEQLEPEIDWHELLPGDLFLLCSDGLVDRLCDQDLTDCIKSSDQDGTILEETARRLIDAALKSGSRDNITVLLVRLAPKDFPRNGSAVQVNGRRWMAGALGVILGAILGAGSAVLLTRNAPEPAAPRQPDAVDVTAIRGQLEELRAKITRDGDTFAVLAERVEEVDRLVGELFGSVGFPAANGSPQVASGPPDDRLERIRQLLGEIQSELGKASP